MATTPITPSEPEVSNKDLLAAITSFSSLMDQRFVRIEQRLDHIEQRLDRIEHRLDRLETRMDALEARVTKIEARVDDLDARVTKIGATMVTKDYLDEKLGELRSNLTVKFNVLTDALEQHHALPSPEASSIKRLRI